MDKTFLEIAKPIAEEITAKYGWSVSVEGRILVFFNRKGTRVFTCENKKRGYTFRDTAGIKLLSGRGVFDQSLEKLLTKFYYCQPI